MLVLGMKAALRRRLETIDPTQISWTGIDREMAEDFGYALSIERCDGDQEAFF